MACNCIVLEQFWGETWVSWSLKLTAIGRLILGQHTRRSVVARCVEMSKKIIRALSRRNSSCLIPPIYFFCNSIKNETCSFFPWFLKYFTCDITSTCPVIHQNHGYNNVNKNKETILKTNNYKCAGNQRWIHESPFKSIVSNNTIKFVLLFIRFFSTNVVSTGSHIKKLNLDFCPPNALPALKTSM